MAPVKVLSNAVHMCELCRAHKRKHDVLLIRYRSVDGFLVPYEVVKDWYCGVRVVCLVCIARILTLKATQQSVKGEANES